MEGLSWTETCQREIFLALKRSGVLSIPSAVDIILSKKKHGRYFSFFRKPAAKLY
jgi:hypothetical protein